jgi:RNA methyltransferase, TrmH family
MKIVSLTNQNVKRWIDLKNSSNRQENALFIIEGEKLVSEAFNMGLLVELIYVDPIPSKLAKFNNIYEVDDKVLNKISSLKTPNKVIGICKMPPEDSKLSNIIVALDGVQDPGNGGNIIRTCVGFNIEQVLLSFDTFDQYNEKFIRATMGAFFKVKINKVNLELKLKNLKKLGYKIVVTSAQGSDKIDKIKNLNKCVIVFGSEGHGVSKEVEALADFKVLIKTNSKLESLNVASTAAIVLYEISKD